jgi:hypothetical protein
MRVRVEKERGGWLLRLWNKDYAEVAYASLSIQGLCAEVAFPTEWHENARAWVRLGFGFLRIAFSIPWKWLAPDYMQCAGPTYGFVFFQDGLHLHWGQGKGTRDDPFAIIAMPWRWHHRKDAHKQLSKPETYPYIYTLSSGDVQYRNATIQAETRTWIRPWLPYKRVSRYIDVSFDEGVGERHGSWKGGCTGCSFDMQPGDTPVMALRRMEAERKF